MSIDSLQNLPSFEAKSNIYTDLNGLQNLKLSARKDAKSALPEVARQFEAVMISMMIKNLRKTGMDDPLFNSQAMDSYRDMYDQQLGMELSKGQGIGFAKTIVEQMQYQSGQLQSGQASSSEDMPASESHKPEALIMPQRRFFSGHNTPETYSSSQAGALEFKARESSSQAEQIHPGISADFASPEQFVEKLWTLAEQTAQKLHVSPEVILSQAALETGWGRHVISNGQQSSFNLFNIKADPAWQGKRMDKVSMEYAHGKSIRQKSSFRAYDSFEQSFNDYAHFIKNNPRYKTALDTTEKAEQSLHDKSYIKGIHKAGYATDPDYSNKVLKVLNSEAIQNQRLNQTRLASK